MNVYSTIKLLSFVVHTILGFCILRKGPRRRLNQAFSLAVFSVAVMESGYLMLLIDSGRVLWMRIALVGQCLASANIILLSLIYGRENYRDSLKTGKFYLTGIYFVSLVFLITVLSGILNVQFSGEPIDSFDTVSPTQPKYGLIFSRTGSFFIVFLLICTLIALINLENTYRQARQGGKRIRYPAIVFIGMLSFHLLVYSLALGFSYVRMDILIVASITLVVANMCVAYPIIRPEPEGSRIYVGRAVIAKSYTLLLAGIYLLIIGMLGKIVQVIGRNLNFFLAFLTAFFVLLVLMAVILSKSLKRRFQSFIERNFYRNRYDYRREWENFSRRVFSTSVGFSTKELLQEVLDTVSETIGSDNISIWILDTGYWISGRGMEYRVPPVEPGGVQNDEFLDWLWRYGSSVRIDNGQCKVGGTFNEPPDIPDALFSMLESSVQDGENTPYPWKNPAKSRKLRTLAGKEQEKEPNALTSAYAGAYAPSGVFVPIITERRLIAIMMLGEREKSPYSQEDMDLLETMANQISIAIMNASKSQELALSRELESFYKLSTMLLHDLKSSASMLSLVIQNATDNFDNPEFQRDALSTMSNVVDRIGGLILKLSAGSSDRRFQPSLQPAELTEIVRGAVARSGVRDLARIEVVEELSPVARLMVDPENMERVILNLILNAIEAIEGEGTITIRTCQTPDGHAQVSVSDTGCGMSQEFIRDRLFQPFQTTKDRGLGIGLYQCKAIIDACGGVMDVQSRQGIGSIFTVKLPIQMMHEGLQSEITAPSTLYSARGGKEPNEK